MEEKKMPLTQLASGLVMTWLKTATGDVPSEQSQTLTAEMTEEYQRRGLLFEQISRLTFTMKVRFFWNFPGLLAAYVSRPRKVVEADVQAFLKAFGNKEKG